MKWEYKTEIKSWSDFKTEASRLDYLNKQGADGWEFIDMSVEFNVKYTFMFKRLIDDKKDELLK